MLGHARADPGMAALVLALIATVALYAPSLGRGLVDYDDTYLISDNWLLRHPSLDTIKTIFFDLDSPQRFTLSPEYLPVRDLSVMLDLAIWGNWYPGHHLVNLSLYLAAIALWFAALQRFGIARTTVGLAMLVWAVHPSHAESVAWLAERKGVLAAMFAGVAALSYARFRAGGRAIWLVLAASGSVAAIWSKAPAAFAIAALAALELALPATRTSLKRSLFGLGVLAVTSAAAFVPVLQLARTAAVVGAGDFGPTGRFAMVLGVHGFYTELALMGRANAISYPLGSDGPTVIELVLGAFGLAAAMFAAVAPRGRRWSPPDEVRAGAAFWLVTWLPFSHLILPLQMIAVADRYLLVPSLGLALVLAAGLARIPSVVYRRVLIGVLVVAAAIRTMDAQANWRDATTLWERAVRSNPRDGVAWSALADAYTKAGDRPHAAEVVAEGLLQTRAPRLLLRKALLLLANNNRKAGVRAMREAALAGEPRAMSDLALLLLDDHEIDEALAWARRGASAMSMYAPANRALGRVALAAERIDEALAAFQRAYDLEPTSCTNRYNLALALIRANRHAEARPLLEACAVDLAIGPRARAALATLPP